jgi:hypothetical protein
VSGDRGPLGFGDEPEPEPRDDPPPAPAAEEPSPAASRVPEPARPAGASRYAWFVGVVAFLFVIVAILSSIGTTGGSGPGGPDRGDRLVPFAVPLAAAAPRPDDDANVNPERACGVRGRGILNICDLARRGPVVFTLFPTEGARCRAVLDQFARLAPRVDGVTFVAVGSRGKREVLRGRRDPFPVGWDRDGAVASVYGLVGCPQVTFARRGGGVLRTTRRELTDSELEGHVRDLLKAPER